MKVPNDSVRGCCPRLSLSRLQNEGSQLSEGFMLFFDKSIKATE